MSAYQAAPGQPMQQGEDPGRVLGIVGLILAILVSIVGLIISIVARRKSSQAGFKNGIALAGIIVGIVTTIGTIIVVILFGVLANASINAAQQCKGHPGQPITVSGQPFTCPANS